MKKENLLFPDSLVGTDSHTTMINGLSVLGWGVGGIEAEAVMLGESVAMSIPKVIGVNLNGELNEDATPTDLVLTLTNILRSHGVVNKFVEFYGTGLGSLTLADRATIANMAPEYGATCGFFPIDERTINYLEINRQRCKNIVQLLKHMQKNKNCGQIAQNGSSKRYFLYNENITIDISTIEPVVAGPKETSGQSKAF